MTTRLLRMMLAYALLGIAWVPVTVAQTFSDAELKAFAGIVVEVQRIADSYRPKVEAAQTVREKQKMEVAASDEMTRAVEQEGMTIDRYKEILTQTLSNPEVAGKVKEHVRETK